VLLRLRYYYFVFIDEQGIYDFAMLVSFNVTGFKVTSVVSSGEQFRIVFQAAVGSVAGLLRWQSFLVNEFVYTYFLQNFYQKIEREPSWPSSSGPLWCSG